MNASDLITHSMLEIPGQKHVVVFVYITWPCICQVAGAEWGGEDVLPSFGFHSVRGALLLT